ncbi:MAG TPA: GNAT family N-acetyltransferase [Candidatus Limnocylindrales bacterium]|nr:GNAT family N-acetyltransferase [Candidatus Limnocylindrales bacterium]
MRVSLRVAAPSDDELGMIAAIINVVSPEEPTSIDEMRWADETYPGGNRYVATDGERPVGVATVGRVYMYPPEFPAFWATLHVLAADRGRGVGSALLSAVSEWARAAGKPELMTRVWEAHPDAIDFLHHRGFREYERDKAVELRLEGRRPPPIDLPAGVLVTSLADRPDLVTGVHVVASETFADIPGGGEPIAVGDLEAFRARDVDRPSIPHRAFMIATEASTGRVIGYASLILAPGEPPRKAWHDMTAVARAWRGRGVASALKRATIGWAIDNGLAVLEAGNDTDNAAMRTVNARLGYAPIPDHVTMRGPLFDGIMGSS